MPYDKILLSRVLKGRLESPQKDLRQSSSQSGGHNPGFNAINQFMGLGNDDYPHKLPQTDAFEQLIDCFRLRCEDEYSFGGNTARIYNDENPMREFKKFLDLAEKRKGLLPSWWSKAKRAECIKLATGESSWANIAYCVEKDDIMEHYDPLMPMKLRVLGEKIYRKGFM
ncbi:hypothetical protein B0J14DRAFT_662275 [Halenospora varia]|nr:hypothetical protein B0J14DRAFT_662275 [Halenospora varia]